MKLTISVLLFFKYCSIAFYYLLVLVVSLINCPFMIQIPAVCVYSRSVQFFNQQVNTYLLNYSLWTPMWYSSILLLYIHLFSDCFLRNLDTMLYFQVLFLDGNLFSPATEALHRYGLRSMATDTEYLSNTKHCAMRNLVPYNFTLFLMSTTTLNCINVK